ncbi:MAG: HD domain-containing protein [Clostridia bacterium]|nr:HD domain-containing protein [Clostridia bacterium]
MPSGEANAILQSQDGYLWIGSYAGLIRFDGSTMMDYGKNLENSAIRALFESGSGALYIATRAGVSVFYFKGPKLAPPPAILNSITVDGVLYEHPESLVLPSDTKRVTVDISILLFSETREYMMAYYLEGFDTSEYVTLDKHVSVSYTNLKGGSYALKLRVIDPMTGESTKTRSLTIFKNMQITESVWFYVALALLIALLVWLIVRAATRHKMNVLMKKQEEQSKYINDITKVFSECVDMRDPYTNGHSARVARYTAMLAEKLGKNKEQVERMYHIALLHDVGKISIPDAILNKPEKLTEEEFLTMRSHAQRGYDVLKEIAIDPDLALGAGFHHERYDGKGYPKGLKGDEIPEVAQIIGVADTFDAMYSTRPYRKKMELSAVVKEISRISGTQLSPRVVDAFLQLYEEGAFNDA